MIVQIYGINDVESAVMCAKAGAQHIGVGIGDPGEHVDLKTVGQTRAIFDALPAGTTKVGLVLTTDLDKIVRLAQAVMPDYLHLTVELEVMTPEVVAGLRKRLPGQKIMQGIPVGGPETRDEALRLSIAYQEVAEILLLDTARPGHGEFGATGLAHDWSIDRAIVETVRVPVILAGGLGPDNVYEAIRAVRPWGVDSLTRTSVPGDRHRKDPQLVRRLIAEAKRATADFGL